MRSLGHLSAMPVKPSASSARATATPTASDSPARNPAPCSKLQPSENVRLPPTIAGPRPASPPAPRRLPLGRQRDRVHVAALQPAHQLGRRGIDLVDDLERDLGGAPARRIERLEPRHDGFGIQEVGRLQQPVAAALDALEREPRRLGVLQHLRYAGAGEPDRGGQVLAGVHGPVAWMVTSCRYVSRSPGASFRLFSRAPTTAFLAAATSRDSRRGFFARPPGNLESPGGPPSSSSRASSSSWCRSAIWFQMIAWARVRSAGTERVEFREVVDILGPVVDRAAGFGLGPSQISAQESVPARVDRHRLGDAGELGEQALRASYQPISWTALMMDPIRSRVSRSASFGSIRWSTGRTGPRSVSLVPIVAGDQGADLAEPVEDRLAERRASPSTPGSGPGPRRTRRPSGAAAPRSRPAPARREAVPVGPALAVVAPIEGGQAADEELPLAQRRAPRQVAEHPQRTGLVPGLELLQRLADQSRLLHQLRRGRAGPVRMDHELVGHGLGDLVLEAGRAQPLLDRQRRLLEAQPRQQPDQLLRRVGLRHPEVEQVLGHLDGRRPHPLLQELPRPQEVGALEQPMVLRRRLLLEAELGLLDRVLVPLLSDQALGLRSEGSCAPASVFADLDGDVFEAMEECAGYHEIESSVRRSVRRIRILADRSGGSKNPRGATEGRLPPGTIRGRSSFRLIE